MITKIDIKDASIAEEIRKNMNVATASNKGLMPTLPLVNGLHVKYVTGGKIYKIATSNSLWHRATFLLHYCSDSTLSTFLGSITYTGSTSYIVKVAKVFNIGPLMKFYHKENSLYFLVNANPGNWGGLYYAGDLLLREEDITIDDTFSEISLI